LHHRGSKYDDDDDDDDNDGEDGVLGAMMEG
jgi:hypothetical protein